MIEELKMWKERSKGFEEELRREQRNSHNHCYQSTEQRKEIKDLKDQLRKEKRKSNFGINEPDRSHFTFVDSGSEQPVHDTGMHFHARAKSVL